MIAKSAMDSLYTDDIDYNNALIISEYVNKKLVICGGLNIWK